MNSPIGGFVLAVGLALILGSNVQANASWTASDSDGGGLNTAQDVPGPPTILSAIPEDGSVTLHWTAPASDGGSPITGYRLRGYAAGELQLAILIGPVLEGTVLGLINGTTYTFTMAAVNAAGEGPESTPSNPVTPRTLPGAPTLISASPDDGSVTLAWSAPESDGGDDISGYTATASPGGASCSTESLSCTISGLDNGTIYTFTVTASNAAGDGPASNALNATPFTVPGAPTLTSASAGDASVALTWTPPASNGGDDISGYTATASPGGASCSTESLSCTISGLDNGTIYTFSVTAKNAAGTGPASDGVSATPFTTPDPAPPAPPPPSPPPPSAPPSPARFTLTVSKSGAGAGTVTSDVGGVSCGAACAAELDAGATVALTARAAAGSTFAGWSGACNGDGPCTVTMDSVKTVTAMFGRAPALRVCVTPDVKGKPLATAKRRIAAGRCRVGTIKRVTSTLVPKGRVISQSPKAGRKLRVGSKVNLVVSRGRS